MMGKMYAELAHQFIHKCARFACRTSSGFRWPLQPRGSAQFFFNGSNTPALTGEAEERHYTHNGGEPFTPGKSRIGFHSHRECMEDAHEYANKLGKQGGENTKERFSRTTSKK